MKLYFSHPYALRTEAKQWMKFLKDNCLDLEIIDPLQHPYTQKWFEKLEPKERKELAKKIVEKDLDGIKKSDAVVVFYPEMGVATAIEIWIAHKHDKPIFVVTAYRLPHPWLVYCEAIVIQEGSELLEALKGMIGWL